tara:strand:+ start:1029 stop:1772 length:744 start_codon:yes stop_codon:yes gene_type:complete
MKPVAKDEQNIKNRISQMYGEKVVPTREAIAKSLGEKLKAGVIDQTLHDKAIAQLNGNVQKSEDGELEKAHKYISRSGSKGHYKYVYRDTMTTKTEKHIELGDRVITPYRGTITVGRIDGDRIYDNNGRSFGSWELKGAEILNSPAVNNRRNQTIQDAHNAKRKAEARERQANKMTSAKYDSAIKEWASSLSQDLGDTAMENAHETVDNFIMAHPNVSGYIDAEHKRSGIFDVSARERIQWDIEGQL